MCLTTNASNILLLAGNLETPNTTESSRESAVPSWATWLHYDLGFLLRGMLASGFTVRCDVVEVVRWLHVATICLLKYPSGSLSVFNSRLSCCIH